MINNTFLISIANIIARLTHLLLFVVIGNRYGISGVTDEIFLIYAPLAVLMTVTNSVAEVVVMPIFHRAKMVGVTDQIAFLFIKIIFLAVPITAAVVLLLSYMFFFEFNYFVFFIFILLPILSTLSSFFMGYLNSRDKLAIAMLGPFYGGIIAIPVCLYLDVSTISLALVFLVFELFRFLGLYFHSNDIQIKNSKIYSRTKELFSWGIKNAKIQAVGALLLALNPMIDIYFANNLDFGDVTNVEYANRLWNIVYVVFVGFIAFTYAQMSKSAANNSLNKKRVNIVSFWVGIVALIISLIVIIFSDLIIDNLYRFSNMNDLLLSKLSTLFVFYLVGTAPFIASMIYVRAFSALGVIRILSVVAFISVISNILLNFILIKYFGVYGIGLSTSICNFIALLILVYYFNFKIYPKNT